MSGSRRSTRTALTFCSRASAWSASPVARSTPWNSGVHAPTVTVAVTGPASTVTPRNSQRHLISPHQTHLLPNCHARFLARAPALAPTAVA